VMSGESQDGPESVAKEGHGSWSRERFYVSCMVF
jgi:hypothetical protein